MTFKVKAFPDSGNFPYYTDPQFLLYLVNKSDTTYKDLKVVTYIKRGSTLANYDSYTIKKFKPWTREFIHRWFDGWLYGKAQAQYDRIPWTSGSFYIYYEIYHKDELLDSGTVGGWGCTYLSSKVLDDYYDEVRTGMQRKYSGWGNIPVEYTIYNWAKYKADVTAYFYLAPWDYGSDYKYFSVTTDVYPQEHYRREFTYNFELSQKYVMWSWCYIRYIGDYSIHAITEADVTYILPESSNKGEVTIDAPDHVTPGETAKVKVSVKNTHNSYTGKYYVYFSVYDEEGNEIFHKGYFPTLAPGATDTREFSFTMPERKATAKAWLYAYYWKDWWDFK